MRKIAFLCTIALLTIITSCNKDYERVTIEKVTLKDGQSFDDFLKNYNALKTFDNNNDVTFFLARKKDDNNKLLFYTKGLKTDLKEILNFQGNVLDVFVADINSDNYKELYITSSPLKGNSYQTVENVGIFGYTLTPKNNVARLKVEEIEGLEKSNTDKVTLNNNVLARTYIDNNKEYTYQYELSTENYTLIPKKVK